MILLDTGILVGAVDSRDPHHAPASKAMQVAMTGRHGRVAALDAVYIETMNYLARKPRAMGNAAAIGRLRQDPGSPIMWLPSDPKDFTVAAQVYFREFGRRLSMTDCLIVAAAKRLGAQVSTLDAQLRALAG